MASKPEWWDKGVSVALGGLLETTGQSGCVVAYYGTVIALAGAEIRASEDRPYPVAVDSQGRFVPASWGDFVVGMAKSDALADGPVTVEIRLPRPEGAL